MKIDTQCAAVPPRLPSLAPLRPHQVHPPGAFECIVRSVSSFPLTLLILSYPPSKLIFTSELFCLFIHARFSRYLAPALTCLCWWGNDVECGQRFPQLPTAHLPAPLRPSTCWGTLDHLDLTCAGRPRSLRRWLGPWCLWQIHLSLCSSSTAYVSSVRPQSFCPYPGTYAFTCLISTDDITSKWIM